MSKAKPYKIIGRAEGRDSDKWTDSFATLKEASHHIQSRWQGTEYKDGNEDFHTDYSTFELVGFTFKDIGHTVYGDSGDPYDREFVFNDPVPPTP